MLRYLFFIAIPIFLMLSCDPGPYKKAMDLNKQGVEYFLNQNDSALYYFNLAIKTDSTFQPAIQNKANFYIKRGDYKQAIEAIDLLIKLKPYAEAWLYQGMLFDLTGQHENAQRNYENAINEYNNAIKKSTSSKQIAMTKIQLGLNYFLLGDTVKAKQLLEENKNEAQDLGAADSILTNLDNKQKVIKLLLNKS